MPGITLCFPLSRLKIVLFTGIGRNKTRIELFCPLFLRGAVAVLVHLDLKLALEGVYCVFVCIFVLWRFQFVPSSLVLTIKYIPSSLPSSSSGLFKTNKKTKTLFCGLIDIQKAVHFKYIQLKLGNIYTLWNHHHNLCHKYTHLLHKAPSTFFIIAVIIIRTLGISHLKKCLSLQYSIMNSMPYSVLPGGSDGKKKKSMCNTGDLGSIPGLGKFPGEENGNPLQDFCLENSVDRGAWWATVHGFTKSQTRLRA